MEASQTSSSELLSETNTISNRLNLQASGDAATTVDFFPATIPTIPADAPVSGWYLEGGDRSPWENYLAYGDLSITQSKRPFKKLQATIRTFGYRLEQQSDTKTLGSARTTAASILADDPVASGIDQLTALIDELKNGDLTTGIIDLITYGIQLVYTTLQSLFGTETLKALAYAALAYLAVEELLGVLKTKSLENLSFSEPSSVILRHPQSGQDGVGGNCAVRTESIKSWLTTAYGISE